MTNTVAFPRLWDKVFELNTVATPGFFIEIKWYGVLICLGLCLATAYVLRRSREFGTNPDEMLDILIWSVPLGIIGARAYYVVNRWEDFSGNFWSIFEIWHGGLAIYGGIIFGFLTAFIFCRIKKIDFLNIADLASMGFLIGQAVGRWGNFVNAEVYGFATSLPWGMSINGGAPVHPAFIYESLWNAAGFVFLYFYSKKRRFKGELLLMYLGWYGLGRAWIEGIRADTLFLGSTSIKISQALAALCFVGCAAALIYLHATKKYKKILENTEEEHHDID